MSDMSLQRSTVPAELLCAQPLWALFLLLSYKHWRKYKYVGACLGRREGLSVGSNIGVFVTPFANQAR